MKQFGSLTLFAEHLMKVAAAEELLIRKAVKHCAAIVEEEVRAELGNYQDQAGPFIAWPELADSTKAGRLRQGYTEDDPGLRSGAMRDSIGSTTSADGMEAQVGSNDDHMVYFELGTSKQPPRSALGGAMARKLPEIREILGTAIHAGLIGDRVFEKRLTIEDPDV